MKPESLQARGVCEREQGLRRLLRAGSDVRAGERQQLRKRFAKLHAGRDLNEPRCGGETLDVTDGRAQMTAQRGVVPQRALDRRLSGSLQRRDEELNAVFRT